MKYSYKETNPAPNRAESDMVQRSDGAWVPKDPANTDYQAYLAWLAEGNAPLPPEENLNGN